MPEVMNKQVLAIEYPCRNEKISSDNYTFRIVAMPGVKKMEISIDGCAWEPCRQSGESFWYDWSGYESGEHEAVARMQLPNGRVHTSEPRFFTVELDGSRKYQYGGERRTISPRRAQQFLGRPDMYKYMASKCVVVCPNKPEILSQLTRLLSQEGVNIDSLLLETFGDVASCRFLVEKDNGLRQTLEKEGFHIVEDKVFRMDIPNQPGSLDQLTRKLSEQGIGIRYLYGTSHGQTTKVVFSVDRMEDAACVVKDYDQQYCAVEA